MTEPDTSVCEEVRDLLSDFMEYSGLRMLEHRSEEFERLVRERVRKKNLPSLSGYRSRLQDPGFRAAEYKEFAAKLTIGETYFMRHPQVFAALKAEWEQQVSSGRLTPFRVWCAACSIGCEPYSLSILLDALREQYAWVDGVILASDLNTEFITLAEAASYGSWSFRSLGPEFQQRYFTASGSKWVLQDHLRKAVRFFFCNLMQPLPPVVQEERGRLDALFCRNVLIYFNQTTIETLAKRFYDLLAPGGWLVLGPSENNWEIFHQFEAVSLNGAVMYRKPLDDSQIRQRPALFSLDGTLPSQVSPPGSEDVPVAVPLPSEPVVRDWSFDQLRNMIQDGEVQEAFERVEQALVLQDLDPDLHMFLGYLAGRTHRQNEQTAYYKRALFLDLHHVESQYLLACHLAADGSGAQLQKQLRMARNVLEKSSQRVLRLPDGDLSKEHALMHLNELQTEGVV